MFALRGVSQGRGPGRPSLAKRHLTTVSNSAQPGLPPLSRPRRPLTPPPQTTAPEAHNPAWKSAAEYWQGLTWRRVDPTRPPSPPPTHGGPGLRFAPTSYRPLILKFKRKPYPVLKFVDWSSASPRTDVERLAVFCDRHHSAALLTALEARQQEKRPLSAEEYAWLIQYYLVTNVNPREVWRVVKEIQSLGLPVARHTAAAVTIVASAEIFATTPDYYLQSNSAFADTSASASVLAETLEPRRLPPGLRQFVAVRMHPLLKFFHAYSKQSPNDVKGLLRTYVDVMMRKGTVAQFLAGVAIFRKFPYPWLLSDIIKSSRSWTKSYSGPVPKTHVDHAYLPYMIRQLAVIFIRFHSPSLTILAQSAEAHAKDVSLPSKVEVASVTSSFTKLPTKDAAVEAATATFRELAYLYAAVLGLNDHKLARSLKPLLIEAGRLTNRHDAAYTIKTEVRASIFPLRPEAAIDHVLAQMHKEGLKPSEAHYALMLRLSVTTFRHDEDCYRRVLNAASAAGFSPLESMLLRIPMTLRSLLQPDLSHTLRWEISTKEPLTYLKPWDKCTVAELRSLSGFTHAFAALPEALPFALTLLDWFMRSPEALDKKANKLFNFRNIVASQFNSGELLTIFAPWQTWIHQNQRAEALAMRGAESKLDPPFVTSPFPVEQPATLLYQLQQSHPNWADRTEQPK